MRRAVWGFATALAACGGVNSAIIGTVADGSADDGSSSDAAMSPDAADDVSPGVDSGTMKKKDGGRDSASADSAPMDSAADAPADAPPDGGTFACGSASCVTASEYCRMVVGSAPQCLPLPNPCASPGNATCACVEMHDRCTAGPSCAESNGEITRSCTL